MCSIQGSAGQGSAGTATAAAASATTTAAVAAAAASSGDVVRVLEQAAQALVGLPVPDSGVVACGEAVPAPSRILDLGGATRLVPTRMRRALYAIYPTCCYNNCPLPARWCEIDRIHPGTPTKPTRPPRTRLPPPQPRPTRPQIHPQTKTRRTLAHHIERMAG